MNGLLGKFIGKVALKFARARVLGQFVARDVQKMLDLQAVVQNLGVKGRGKHWIVVLGGGAALRKAS